MSETGSISQILVDIKRGDEAAAEQLWRRMIGAVAGHARRKLEAYRVRGADQEDIAIDVFASLCRGAPNQRFPKLNDREDLWQVLMMLIRQKVIDRKRKRAPEWTESAIGQRGEDESALWGLDVVAGDELPPDVVAIGSETLRELLDQLNESRRQVVLLKMDGFTLLEISQRLGMSESAVGRKLKDAKECWKRKQPGGGTP